MARTAWPTVLSGDSWTASQHNTYGRDNDLAYWVFTTAGDLAYATSSSALARLAIGSSGGILKSTGSAPAWTAGGSQGTIFYNSAANTPAWLTAGGAGSLFYNNGANTPAWLTNGAIGTALYSNGTTPVWLNGFRIMGFLLNTDVALTSGDDALRFRIPSVMDNWIFTTVAASRKSGTGVPSIQIRNVTDAVDVLSTQLTIDSGETDSSTAATPAVINASNRTVSTADQFAIDVDAAGTATLYLYVELGFKYNG